MGFSIDSKGDFTKTINYLEKMSKGDMYRSLNQLARQGVAALSSATPVESSRTATSWSYEIIRSKGSYSIVWKNSHVEDGVPIAIILQYGHGTGTGGYVKGRDYINPAIKPVMDSIADNVWKAVTSA